MSRKQSALLEWYSSNRRDLPWRATGDPYRIWISEIMLQQTRASAVIPYYESFLARFPDVESLAKAPGPDVLACWSGLGYYSRARNLQAAARRIVQSGRFPSTFEAIRALPGVGPYTAAAIASIAFDLPHAVLDGNVMRVIARLRNDPADISSTRTRVRFQQIAEALLDRGHPGKFNQAMMELGATICLPRAPRCLLCPVAANCEARRQGTQDQLPVKLRRMVPVHIESEIAVVQRRGGTLMRQRPADSTLMPGFWELPSPGDLPGLLNTEFVGSFRHCITHHNYVFSVVRGNIRGRLPGLFRWLTSDDLACVPVSTIAVKALKLIRAGG